MASSGIRRYTTHEEIANSVTHAAGIVLSIIGSVFLAHAAARLGGLALATCLVFGCSLVALYTASTLYHAVSSTAAKRILRVLDHAAIGGAWGWALFATVWGLAGVGVATTVVAMHRFKVLSMVLYLVMGWLVLVAAHRLISSLAAPELALLLVGGLCYTGGLVFYGWRSLPYGHSIWHFFVLAGSALHFFAVLLVVSV